MVAASAESWNEMSYLPPALPSQRCYSGMSGSRGCEAHWQESWFQLPWPEEWENTSTSVKELVPIIMAAAIWRPQWMGLSVLALCGSGAANQRKVGKGPGHDAPPTLFVLF